ncbi:MAG: hypothetical protein HY921_06515 [Elusimicrobia bacterium]|nr:hypothetical protein [Elusimicrobiota bacterium]
MNKFPFFALALLLMPGQSLAARHSIADSRARWAPALVNIATWQGTAQAGQMLPPDTQDYWGKLYFQEFMGPAVFDPLYRQLDRLDDEAAQWMRTAMINAPTLGNCHPPRTRRRESQIVG